MSGIVQVQAAIQDLQCQDPRDKIFTIISLFGSSCTIKPDYGISCFELALGVLREYAACDRDHESAALAQYLSHNLRLDLASAEIDAALMRNQVALPVAFVNRRPVMLRETTPWACQVLPNEAGQMTAPFITHQSPHSEYHVDGRTIVVDRQPVAIATCDFAIGDWIAPLSDFMSDDYTSYCVGLVIRVCKENTYNIVGEVVFFPFCQPCVS